MEQTTVWQDMQIYIDWIKNYCEIKAIKDGHAPRAFTHSYGCQQNVSDGEKLSGMLSEMGFELWSGPQGADLVLYNTCAIRENAEHRIFGNVGALKHAKLRNPDMVVGLCGCMMQQGHVADKIKNSFPYVDLVFGTHALPRLPELLYRKLKEGGRVFEVADHKGEIVEDLPLLRDGDIKAWLPIMYGCDNFCSYCVVPLVRGRERSRETQKIIAEARGIPDAGYREITLLGQNVNSYGKGLDGGVNFSQLLRRIDDIDGEYWLRFMTSHPKDCTRELIDTIADSRHICRHIHLPVQSGSNRVLKAMNRSYTRESYLELIAYAKERIPGVTFTSDIIVGFPGETEDEFRQTLSLVEEVGYQSLFMFIYSKRQGTRAADMDDPVSKEEKSRRFQQLLALQNDIGLKTYEELVGQTVTVLAEGPGKNEGTITGRTQSSMIVEFPGDWECIGRFVDVKITQALKWAVLGEIIRRT